MLLAVYPYVSHLISVGLGLGLAELLAALRATHWVAKMDETSAAWKVVSKAGMTVGMMVESKAASMADTTAR